MPISDDRRDKALTYLATTDEDCARAKALMKGLEHQEKTILGLVVLDNLVGTTVQEREAIARTHETYREWIQSYKDAVFEYEKIRNKRLTEEMIVECWRSENANRRVVPNV